MILTWQNFEGFNHGLKPPEKNLFNFQFRQGDRYFSWSLRSSEPFNIKYIKYLNNLDHLDPDLAHHLKKKSLSTSSEEP